MSSPQLGAGGGDDSRAIALGQRGCRGERVEVGANACEWRAQLVRGVGDESSLGEARPLERGEHRVEAVGEPSQLSILGDLDAMAEVLRAGDVFGGAGEPPDRAQSGARDEQAKRGGQRDSACADEDQHEAKVGEGAFDARERQRDLQHADAAGSALAEHARVHPPDGRVGDEGSTPAGGDSTGAGTKR